MVKNAFYFILKDLFVLKIFKFLSWLFGHVEKTALWEMQGQFQNLWRHSLVSEQLKFIYCPISHEAKPIRQWNLVISLFLKGFHLPNITSDLRVRLEKFFLSRAPSPYRINFSVQFSGQYIHIARIFKMMSHFFLLLCNFWEMGKSVAQRVIVQSHLKRMLDS